MMINETHLNPTTTKSNKSSYLNELPKKFEVYDQAHFIQLKSQNELISSISFHPEDWIFSFDLMGELQGKVFAKLVVSKNSQIILNNPHDRENLLTSIENFLNRYLNLLEDKFNIMSEVVSHADLGTKVVPPMSLQLENQEWIRFTAKYMYISQKINLPVELNFQFVKKGSHSV